MGIIGLLAQFWYISMFLPVIVIVLLCLARRSDNAYYVKKEAEFKKQMAASDARIAAQMRRMRA